MKKSLLFILLSIISFGVVEAQVESPAGMRYQAIARGSDGKIRSNERLNIKAELLALDVAEEVMYVELHEAISGEFGLINITLGEGQGIRGAFKDVPWNRQIWARISVKNADSDDYQLVSISKLYSVPYAFYAASAGKIAGSTSDEPDGDGSRGVQLDQTSPWWSLEGNYNSHKKNGGPAMLGTTDRKQLTIITNNIPRITIDWLGNISFIGPINMNGDLNVNGNTTLNGSLDVVNMHPTTLTGKLTVDKITTLNDEVNVANMSPTHMTGLLDVDKTLNVDGATTLNSSLDVTGMSPTHLSGTLLVDKATTLNNTLTVTNEAPTQLTGTLDVDKTLNVDGATTLNSTLNVTGMNATTLTGTLGVDKATTLNSTLTVANQAPTHLTGDLDVDGDFNAGGDITIDGPLVVENMNPSHLTGTLEVDKLARLEGGVHVSGQGTLGPNGDHVAFFDNVEGGTSDGVAIRIQNPNTTAQNNFVTFYKQGDAVAGRIEGYVLNDIGSPPIPTDDEIWSAVCIVIADYNPLTLFWTQFANNFNLVGTIWNGATIPAFEIPDFPGLTLPDYPGLVLPDYPGLALPDFPGLTIPGIPSVSIEGVGTIFPGLDFPDIPSFGIPDVPSFGIPDVPSFGIPDVPAFEIPNVPAFNIPDMPELDLSADLFEWPTIPTFSDILVDEGICPDVDIFAVPNGYVYRLIEWGVQNDMQNMISFNPIDLAAKVLTWGVTKVVKSGGITYGSKGADYAEYLPKLHENEKFLGGEIVGVHGGRISKVTSGADQILAISTKPLVLGNQPNEDEKDNFEKVGFLGQVPVFVQGPVALGDYIVPSGKNDGIGKAIKPGDLNADVLPEIFGKAWSETPYETTTVINVSIGLRPTEIAEVLRQREENLKSLQEQMNLQNQIHTSLQQNVDMLKEYVNQKEASGKRLK